jgi:hypothetical protein
MGALARRRRCASGRPRRPRRAPPSRDGHVRPQHLSRCEGGHGGRHPADAKKRKLSSLPPKRRIYGGAVAYLRVENPRFLFLGGSADVVAAAGVATASPRVIPATRAGASVARVACLIGCLAAGAPAPALGAVSSAASAALGEGGEGSHLSGRVCPPSLSSSSSSDNEYSEVAGEESPSFSRSRNSSLLCSQRSRRRIRFSFLRAARSCSRRCAAHARSGSGRGRVGPCGVHGHHLQRASETPGYDDTPRINRLKRGRNPLTNGP